MKCTALVKTGRNAGKRCSNNANGLCGKHKNGLIYGGGGDGEDKNHAHVLKLLDEARRVLNYHESGYLTGSLAIYLHALNAGIEFNLHINDIDIVIVSRDTLTPYPSPRYHTEGDITTSHGVTFINMDLPEISIDVMINHVKRNVMESHDRYSTILYDIPVIKLHYLINEYMDDDDDFLLDDDKLDAKIKKRAILNVLSKRL